MTVHAVLDVASARPLASRALDDVIGAVRASYDQDSSGDLRTTVHIVSESAGDRAMAARMIFALGHHAEVYSSAEEFIEHAPARGLALVREDNSGCAQRLVALMCNAGFWLPAVAWSDTFECDVVVSGVKAGVLDYISGQNLAEVLRTKIRGVLLEANRLRSQQERRAAALRIIARLSQRESEVLNSLAEGHSNKEMARLLDISPRTVEIHRMKMMGKLGAKSSAEAIRIKLDADRY